MKASKSVVQEFAGLRGDGVVEEPNPFTTRDGRALRVACPTCSAPPGEKCRAPALMGHTARLVLAEKEVVGELKRRPAEAIDAAEDAKTVRTWKDDAIQRLEADVSKRNLALTKITQKIREMKDRRRRLRRLFWRTQGGFCIDGMERGFATIHEGRDWLKMARLAYPNMKKSDLKLMRVYVYAK